MPIDRVFDILQQLNIALEIPAGVRNKWDWNKSNPELFRNLVLSGGSDTHRIISEVGNIDKTISFLEINRLDAQIINLKGKAPK